MTQEPECAFDFSRYLLRRLREFPDTSFQWTRREIQKRDALIRNRALEEAAKAAKESLKKGHDCDVVDDILAIRSLIVPIPKREGDKS